MVQAVRQANLAHPCLTRADHPATARSERKLHLRRPDALSSAATEDEVMLDNQRLIHCATMEIYPSPRQVQPASLDPHRLLETDNPLPCWG